MLEKTLIRLLLTILFAFIGMIVGVGLVHPLSTVLPLPGGCMMGQMMFGMLVGCLLGGLLGCAIAVPRMGASLPRRILSFILAPAVTLLGICALEPLIVRIGPQYEKVSLLVFFLLILPALLLFGFSIPVMLSRGTIRPVDETIQVNH